MEQYFKYLQLIFFEITATQLKLLQMKNRQFNKTNKLNTIYIEHIEYNIKFR